MAVQNSLARQDQSMKLSVYLQNDAVKKQINQVVGGKNGTRFISSIVSAVQSTPALQECTSPKLHYHFTPNIPSNVLEESQIAGNLEGIVSQETQLGVLSVVDNVQNEMKKIENEQEKAKTDPVMMQMFGGAGDGKSGVLEKPGNRGKEA